jgi:hypothetical protein
MVSDGGLFFDKAYGQGAGKIPRLFLFHWPQGVAGGHSLNDNAFHPKYRGALVQAGKSLPSLLAPMQEHLNDINVVTGLNYGPIYSTAGSHGHASAFYTGYQVSRGPGESGVANGASVDQIAADALGINSPIRALRTCGPGGVDSEAYWSWRSAGQKNDFYHNPEEVFGVLTGSLATGDDGGAFARRLGVVGLVKEDIRRLKARLGREDLARLDNYLSFVDQIQSSLVASQNLTCDVNYTVDDSRGTGLVSEGGLNAELMDLRSRIMMDLQVLAMSCDLTRVGFHTMGRTGLAMPLAGTDYHEATHAGTTYQAQLNAGVTRFMQCFSYMIASMKATDVGGGSLWDSAVVVGGSEFSHGFDHSTWSPVVMVGGKLKPMASGNHVVFPYFKETSSPDKDFLQAAFHKPVNGETDNPRCVNDLWQTVLQALGVFPSGQKFGDQNIHTSLALPGLWQV